MRTLRGGDLRKVRLRTRGEGQKISFFSVRTIWMAPKTHTPSFIISNRWRAPIWHYTNYAQYLKIIIGVKWELSPNNNNTRKCERTPNINYFHLPFLFKNKNNNNYIYINIYIIQYTLYNTLYDDFKCGNMNLHVFIKKTMHMSLI